MTARDPRCLCDGGAYEIKDYPFIINPECSIHGCVARQPVPCVALDDALGRIMDVIGAGVLARHETGTLPVTMWDQIDVILRLTGRVS